MLGISAFALGNAVSTLQEMFPVVFQTLFAGEPFGRKFSQTASDLKIQSVVFDNPRYVQASLHVMKTLCFNCYLGLVSCKGATAKYPTTIVPDSTCAHIGLECLEVVHRLHKHTRKKGKSL